MLFHTTFVVLGALCAFYAYKTNPFRSAPSDKPSTEFLAFQRNYVTVFWVMMMADWLQGPYVYALYESYGYNQSEIGSLFIAGFGASLVFGTVVGSFGDKLGRRRTCLLFGVLYSLSCVTKHFPSFYMLMLGRLLGGVATSLLFSSFESWMVSEHFSRSFSRGLLGDTFAQAYFGNSVVAILAGLLGGWAASAYGLVAPFDCSLVMLVVGTVIVYKTWNENYGDSTKPFREQFTRSLEIITTNRTVVLAGAAQSLFEGAMYTFVFMWTPAVENTAKAEGYTEVPHGLIFAVFMVSCMIGSCLYKAYGSEIPARTLLTYVIAAASVSLAPAALGLGLAPKFFGFCLFEGCVGCYWPLIGGVRSEVIPEEARSTIMSMFRVPLNLIVVAVLYHIGELSEVFVFRFCVALLLGSACLANLMATKTGASEDEPVKAAAGEKKGESEELGEV